MRTDEAAKGTGPREGKHTCVRCGQVHMVSATFLGLGRGSSSQYSVYTGCVSYTRLGTVHYFGEAKTGRGQAATPAPPAGERDSSEAPPEGPAGGALGGSRWRRPAGGTCSRDSASLELKNTSKSFLDHFFKEIWWYTD